MINRVLIRIRVLQIVFSHSQQETLDLKAAESELLYSFQKSYDLYHYYLQLILDITDTYEQQIELKRNKLLLTEEDRNPNTRLIDNRFVKQLRANKELSKYLSDRPFDWDPEDAFLRNILEEILESNNYAEYIANSNDCYDTDKEFWRKTFRKFVCASEDINDYLEDSSLYWNDDIEIVESFALKTIKQFDEKDGENSKLLPKFRDSSDEEYAVKLFRECLLNWKDNKALVEKHTANWDSERIAPMDMVIMIIAITEILTFPSIPTSVSLNEYINLSKSYSTEKSSSFINGVLDAIIKELKTSNKLMKK